jgi:hypothetical protein
MLRNKVIYKKVGIRYHPVDALMHEPVRVMGGNGTGMRKYIVKLHSKESGLGIISPGSGMINTPNTDESRAETRKALSEQLNRKRHK